MKPVTRKRYTAEFKAQAVGLVGLGKPVSEVAEDLGIGDGRPLRVGAQGLATCAARERRAASRRRAARSGRAAQVATRKCQPQTGERHFKKGCRHPRDQTPAGRRAMIAARRAENRRQHSQSLRGARRGPQQLLPRRHTHRDPSRRRRPWANSSRPSSGATADATATAAWPRNSPIGA